MSGYTKFPNEILDNIMPHLSPNGWKLFCFVWRKTAGWDKERDEISYSQIKDGTGIGSKNTVSNAIREVSKFIIVNASTGRSNYCEFDISNLKNGIETVLFTNKKSTEIDHNGIETVPINTEKSTVFDLKSTETDLKSTEIDLKSTETVHTKETNTKEINKEDNNEPTIQDFWKIYQTEIGSMSPIIARQFGMYSEEVPIQWMIESVEIAVENNVRKPSYIYGCLDKAISVKKPPRLVFDNGGQNGHSNGAKRTGQNTGAGRGRKIRRNGPTPEEIAREALDRELAKYA